MTLFKKLKQMPSPGTNDINAPEKLLNEAEILSIKRLRQKGLQYYEIADRIGISEERVRSICKGGH